MNLAEKIITLRTARNMSQGDLAEKLGVSRQSVSKWETGASIPDLEKLITMSELFQITLDELVKGSCTDALGYTDNLEHNVSPQDGPAPQIIYVQTPVETTGVSNTQRTVGFILLITGIASILLEFLVPTSGLLAIIGAYIILCSILCLIVKKNAGLKIAWITALFLFGVTMPYGLFMAGFSPFNMAGLVTILTWIFIIILTIVTIKNRRKKK